MFWLCIHSTWRKMASTLWILLESWASGIRLLLRGMEDIFNAEQLIA